ncbi:carbon-nitrogen hydrolase family protein [Neptuniibacter sp. QD72_48]|uniref:carbon-nitrogen hydrolase family protein n=2 Tax=unclassified Neptuniibacter TaxID=2630693 RepID=UPI0039F567E0
MMAKLAVAQMVSGECVDTNLETVELLAEEAANSGAQLLLLPENFALLDSRALIDLARGEVKTRRIHNLLSLLAKKYNLWIVAGSVPVLTQGADEAKDKVWASCLVFDSQGEQKASYNKIHLFDVDVADAHAAYRESDFIQAGSDLVTVDTPFGCIGLAICYDLRFPEQFQRLRQMGADIITVPSAFTYVTGKAHWEVLLRARAIENQCYVLAANQGGEHSPSRKSWGHSMIVGPWGEVLTVRESAGKGLVFADIDLKDVQDRRGAMPVMQHRAKAGF